MKKTAIVAAIGTLLLAGGCSSEPPGPTPEEIRAGQCASFAELSPGYLEMQEVLDIMGDSSATASEKSDAMYRNLKMMTDDGRRTKPYDCDIDTKYFEEYIAK